MEHTIAMLLSRDQQIQLFQEQALKLYLTRLL